MSEDDDRFTEEERITANLRLRSVSPTSRTLLGFFIFIPPKWRGPVAIVVILILGFLAFKLPSFVTWIKSL